MLVTLVWKRLLLRLETTRVEEPERVLHDRPSDRVLVRRHDFVQLGFVERRHGTPVVVVDPEPIRAAELVATRLGDRIHQTAAEPPVLRRDPGGRDRRLLNRILDEEGDRLPAQVLGDRHAVQQEHAVVCHRPGDRERPITAARATGTGRLDVGGHAEGSVQAPVARERRHQRLLHVGAGLHRPEEASRVSPPPRLFRSSRRPPSRRRTARFQCWRPSVRSSPFEIQAA